MIRGWRIFPKGEAMTATYLRNNWYQAAKLPFVNRAEAIDALTSRWPGDKIQHLPRSTIVTVRSLGADPGVGSGQPSDGLQLPLCP